MLPIVLFAAGDKAWASYRAPLERAFAARGLDVRLTDDLAIQPESVDYILYAPASPLRDFAPYTRARLVQSLWAGVERIVGNPTLTQPLARMVDPGLTEGMREYVSGHVLRHHIGMDAHFAGQDGIWLRHIVPPLARERPVAILGLGALGQACAAALVALGFPVLGWSRSPRTLPGVECHAAEAGLQAILPRAQIVVALLPETPETTNLLDARRLALLPRGAVVINAGRGTAIDDDALLQALDAGHLGHATLDVFRVEPLPPEHPFWAHPRVTVTPHVAAETRPDTAAAMVAENIARVEAGAPILHLVDRRRGY